MERLLLGEKNGDETGRTFVTAPSVVREVGGPDGIRMRLSDLHQCFWCVINLIFTTT